MQELFIGMFESFPRPLATFLLAMLPITELRASIPIALEVYHLSIGEAYVYSVLGDIIPVFFILKFLDPMCRIVCQYSKFGERFFAWLFARTRRKFSKKYERFGSLALIIFVAIPLPITGAWSGAVASFLFDVAQLKAFFLISIGVLISGAVVTLLTLGVDRLIYFF